MRGKTLVGLLVLVGLCYSSPSFAQQPSKTKTEGITREQADAILAELRQIRQLLEKEQEPPPPPPKKVQTPVANDWHAIGREDAPVTVIEFADFQCQFCQLFHADTYPLIKKDYVDTGKVRFVSRDFPLPQIHPYALKAAEAARCAGDQGKYWELRNAMLESKTVSEKVVTNLAKTLALDTGAFHACMNSDKYKDAVLADANEALALRIEGTPGFVVARSAKDKLDGVLIGGAASYSSFQSKIDELLAK